LPHRPTNQQVRLFQEPMALWQALCTIPFVGHLQSLENPEK